MKISPVYLQKQAKTMSDIGYFLAAVVKIVDHKHEQENEGEVPVCNQFVMGGLLRGIDLMADRLCCDSEDLLERLEKGGTHDEPH